MDGLAGKFWQVQVLQAAAVGQCGLQQLQVAASGSIYFTSGRWMLPHSVCQKSENLFVDYFPSQRSLALSCQLASGDALNRQLCAPPTLIVIQVASAGVLQQNCG